MNKSDLVNAIAKNEGIEKKCAEKAVNAVFAAVAVFFASVIIRPFYFCDLSPRNR